MNDNGMNLDQIKEFIARQHWIFAKTFAKKAPHEYVVRNNIDGTDEEFLGVVNYIQEHGQTMWYWSMPNKYMFVDGWYYWVMTDNMHTQGEVTSIDYFDATAILNRCKASEYFVSTRWKGLPK